MISISIPLLLARIVYSVCTLYMMAILLRWTAPWLELDLYDRHWRWLPRAADPLVKTMRRILPSMGPMDFGPVAALFVVWLVRQIGIAVVLTSALSG